MLKLAKKKTVSAAAMERVRRRLLRRLFRMCMAAQKDNEQELLIEMMNVYQNILTDLGVVGYWIVPIACTRQGLDALVVGCPDGRALDIPDPFEEIGPPPFPELNRVVEFFLALAAPRTKGALS